MSETVDEPLTAIAHQADPAARVVLDDGAWWLEDPLGRLMLGRSRLEAARDLAQYVALLLEAVAEPNRAAWLAAVAASTNEVAAVAASSDEVAAAAASIHELAAVAASGDSMAPSSRKG